VGGARSESPSVPVEHPASLAEVAFEDEVPDEVSDHAALLGGLLLAQNWDPEVDLPPVPTAPPPAPEIADADSDDHACGAPDDEPHQLPVVDPIVTVRGIQQRLAALGWLRDPVTGVLDEATVAAVKQLQETAGLAMTGLPDGPTRAALIARYGW